MIETDLRYSAWLVLEDGTCFEGYSIGVSGIASAEVVFNTSQTGYQEILTDPSYCQQLIAFSYPHIGNTGINADDQESLRVHARGVIVRDFVQQPSSHRSQSSLDDFLRQQGVIGIQGIDTRALTTLLRDKGTLKGCLVAGSAFDYEAALAQARACPGLQGQDLTAQVTTTHAYQWTQPSWQKTQPNPVYRVIAYDFGVKQNMLRLLVDRGCRVDVVPASTSVDSVLQKQPDGIFLSNGPGDPSGCTKIIEQLQRLMQTDIPIFGICLGYQLLTLACGGQTTKMKFGHHGANHPVKDFTSHRVWVTSQNHNFAVEETNLPEILQITQRSLFDDTIQGVRHQSKPFLGFQGHPEASPGPQDAQVLFDEFITLMRTQTHSVNVGAAVCQEETI